MKWNIFLGVLLILNFISQIAQEQYETALWVFIAFGWWALFLISEQELKDYRDA